MTDMRIIFMGTPDFSVPALRTILEAGYDVVAVYSQPPRPAGRGQKLRLSPVHAFAEQHNIPVFTPKNFKSDDDIKTFQDLNADIAVVVAYGLILPESILKAPKHGCLNIHASLLPRWRGAAPIQRSIMAGDTETGVCIIQMEKGLDTGPVLLRKETPITSKTTASTLHDTLSDMGGEMIARVLDLYKADNPPKAKKQSLFSEEKTYAHMLSRDIGKMDWHCSAEELERKIRALTPWPGVWYPYQDGKKRLKIHAAEIIDTAEAQIPGTILDNTFTIACNSNALRLLSVQPEGKKPMDGAAFLNGAAFKVGDLLC